MPPIQNVIVVGATGNIGGPVVSALLSANFTVSVLTRPTSTKPPNFPPSVSIMSTDYAPASLVAAFTSQDAVVSCVGFPGLAAQADLIDAAAKAGVQRFIPSEYGNDTLNGEIIPELKGMLAVKRKVLEKLIGMEGTGLSWTGLGTGPFLDLYLARGALGMDMEKKTAKLFDGGDSPFTGTLVATITEAVIRILQKPEETRNKFLKIRSVCSTQKQVLGVLERATGGEKWEVEELSTGDMLVSGREKMAKGDRSGFGELLGVQAFERGKERGVVARDGEEGMKVLGFEDVGLDEVVESALVWKERLKEMKEKES